SLLTSILLYERYINPQVLHSFPTRRSSDLTAVIEANAGGSTFKEISAKGMKQIKTILPLHLIVKQYGRIVNSVFDGIKKAENENVTLKKLRDTLLPKLLLGKID